MRSKFVIAALSGLFVAGMAFAQSSSPIAAPVPGPPPPDPQNILNLQLSTGGTVKVQLRPDKAPYSVDRVKTLVRRHFYDGLTFFRVVDGFMDQTGDPQNTGAGGSSLPNVKAEFSFRHAPGVGETDVTAIPAGVIGYIGAMPIVSQPAGMATRSPCASANCRTLPNHRLSPGSSAWVNSRGISTPWRNSSRTQRTPTSL